MSMYLCMSVEEWGYVELVDWQSRIVTPGGLFITSQESTMIHDL